MWLDQYLRDHIDGGMNIQNSQLCWQTKLFQGELNPYRMVVTAAVQYPTWNCEKHQQKLQKSNKQYKFCIILLVIVVFFPVGYWSYPILNKFEDIYSTSRFITLINLACVIYVGAC